MHNKLAILVLAISMLATMAMAEMTGGNGGYTVNLASNATLGTYLVNDTGFTLYYFMNDSPGDGTSTCSGQCAMNWRPFYVKNIVVPAGLNETDFRVIERTDGTEQIAYKGWPLYFFFKDAKPGDTLGQGVKDVWFVVNPSDFPPVKT